MHTQLVLPSLCAFTISTYNDILTGHRVDGVQYISSCDLLRPSSSDLRNQATTNTLGTTPGWDHYPLVLLAPPGGLGSSMCAIARCAPHRQAHLLSNRKITIAPPWNSRTTTAEWRTADRVSFESTLRASACAFDTAHGVSNDPCEDVGSIMRPSGHGVLPIGPCFDPVVDVITCYNDMELYV